MKSAGYKYSGSNDIHDVAWFADNSYYKSDNNPDYGTHDVKTQAPNELGIYDMSGNVWEWCSDWYGNYSSASRTNPQGVSYYSYRVVRGGSWYSNAKYCRSSCRGISSPAYRFSILGFRLVLLP